MSSTNNQAAPLAPTSMPPENGLGIISPKPTTATSAAPLGPDSQGCSLSGISTQFWQDIDLYGSEYQFSFGAPLSLASTFSLVGDAIDPSTPGSTPTSPNGSTELLLDKPDSRLGILGLTGDLDPYILRQCRTDDQGITKFKELSVYCAEVQPTPVQFMLYPPHFFTKSQKAEGIITDNESCLKLQLEKIVPPSTGKGLISLFSRFIAEQYPIFSASQLPDPGSSPTHLLAATYTIAAPFVAHDDKLYMNFAPPLNHYEYTLYPLRSE
ncbi:unnamed protein product [Clonostachys rhizophaga]|uniref:Uncharacterized protein n=1 Tax=Clonostachys rhizophaga TaxID=160324 RepID=A0A9N9V368_9HYPO|nr:unnamed protein product [Clonostachys rhizophaga]